MLIAYNGNRVFNNQIKDDATKFVMYDEVGNGKARQGTARQGKARQGKASQGKARQVKASQGKSREVKRSQEKSREDKLRHDKITQINAKMTYKVEQ